MDALSDAVVDLTTLVSVTHVLRVVKHDDLLRIPGPFEVGKIRAEVLRAARAYLRQLVRPRQGSLDAALLSRCRLAAEELMPYALRQTEALSKLLGETAGALDGNAVARQDLWRLAHLNAALRSIGGEGQESRRSKPHRALRRRFRQALADYTEVLLRSGGRKRIRKARNAALVAIGPTGIAGAEWWVAQLSDTHPRAQQPAQAVVKSLMDMAADWRHWH